MSMVEKIIGLQKKAIEELYVKHNIIEFAQSCFEDITNHVKENPFSKCYDFAFYSDDEDMQKYYQNDFDTAINLLIMEFKKEGFNVSVESECGGRVVYLKW